MQKSTPSLTECLLLFSSFINVKKLESVHLYHSIFSKYSVVDHNFAPPLVELAIGPLVYITLLKKDYVTIRLLASFSNPSGQAVGFPEEVEKNIGFQENIQGKFMLFKQKSGDCF